MLLQQFSLQQKLWQTCTKSCTHHFTDVDRLNLPCRCTTLYDVLDNFDIRSRIATVSCYSSHEYSHSYSHYKSRGKNFYTLCTTQNSPASYVKQVLNNNIFLVVIQKWTKSCEIEALQDKYNEMGNGIATSESLRGRT